MPVGDSLVRLAARRPGGWQAYALRFMRTLHARIGGLEVIAFEAISVNGGDGLSALVHGSHGGAHNGRRGREVLSLVQRQLQHMGYVATVRSTSFSAHRTLRNLPEAAAEARLLDALTLRDLVEAGRIRPARAPRPERPRALTLDRTDELVWQTLPVVRRAVARAWGVEALTLARGTPVLVASRDGTWALRSYILLLSPEGVSLEVEVRRPRGATAPPPAVRQVFAALPSISSWYGDSRWLARRFGRTERSLRAAIEVSETTLCHAIGLFAIGRLRSN